MKLIDTLKRGWAGFKKGLSRLNKALNEASILTQSREHRELYAKVIKDSERIQRDAAEVIKDSKRIQRDAAEVIKDSKRIQRDHERIKKEIDRVVKSCANMIRLDLAQLNYYTLYEPYDSPSNGDY